ncbi:hypothetical protein [Peribacillus sp. SCS-155]|uniref:hypothetical protein n=1 Tax=Peribacillus sedimenti TaxID=3115297 RepID=UPI003905C6AF
MGYIMPVTTYQYMQYANRTAEAEKAPLINIQGIKPIAPVLTFEEHLEAQYKKHEQSDQAIRNVPILTMPVEKPLSNFKRHIPAKLIEQTSAELTGKGRVFNHMI